MHIPRTAYGKAIDTRLVDLGRKQTWLIEEVGKATGLYFDDSYLNKIKIGKLKTPKIVAAINEILGLKGA